MITEAILKHIAPSARQAGAWAANLNAAATEFAIATPDMVAMWLAECAYESVEFNRLEENLNYTTTRLMAVFPHEFPDLKSTEGYDMSPVRLATRLYGGRFGNNKFADGYKYRGRGLLQITFKFNYAVAGRKLGIDLIQFPERMTAQVVAARAAAAFFKDHVPVDLGIDSASAAVSGGSAGLEARRNYYRRAKEVL